MSTKYRRYNQTYAMASGATLTFPLPTAYGHSSGDILVLDSMSCFYTASGAGATANPGGWMKTMVFANSSSVPAIQQLGQIGFFTTGTAGSGINYGGFIWESVDGVPIWSASAAGAISDPSVACTSYGLRHTFLGTMATAGAAVEVFVSWHYENPAERR